MTYKILFSTIYDKKQIKISYRDISISRDQDAANYIKKQWNEMVKKKPSMFAGNLVALEKNNSNSEYIKLDTIHTTYDDFYITRTKEFQKRYPKEPHPSVLSVGCVLVTNDNYVILGVRNNNLALSPGKITIVSGMVDKNDIVDHKHVDLFECIKREIKEEAGIKSNEINDLSCIGLVDNFEQENTFIPFFARVNLSTETINERQKDGEFIEILKIKNSEKSLLEILEKNDALSDIVTPTLQIYLKLFSILNSS